MVVGTVFPHGVSIAIDFLRYLAHSRSPVMRGNLLLVLVCGVSLSAVVPARAGMITTTSYDGDSTSGIRTQYTYTQTIDLGGTTETINGVTFVADSAAT